MFSITNYIKHDLEGIYTAELLRGILCMLFSVILNSLFNLNEAQAYILIIALYGLRPITHTPFVQRIILMCISLSLLTLTLLISLYFGHNEHYIYQAIFSISLACLTIYSLEKIPSASATIMFMSVFSLINFGMGLIDINQLIQPKQIIIASLLGSLCVIFSMICIPVIRFHWCLMINYCFYSQLKSLSKIMSNDNYYESFTDLKESDKNTILMLQSSLMNITNFVKDNQRKNLYLHILNGLMLICFWPASSSSKEHIITINQIRSKTFKHINKLLSSSKANKIRVFNESKSFITYLEEQPLTEFCNGEMINLTIDVINSLINIISIDANINKNEVEHE